MLLQAPAVVADDLQEQVLTIFKTNCSKCHGPNSDQPKALLRVPDILDTLDLVKRGLVLPGDPDGSKLMRLVNNDEMPAIPEAPLQDADKALIRDWITTFQPPLASRRFVSDGEVEGVVRQDIQTKAMGLGGKLRYLSIANLYNDLAVTDDEVQRFRDGLNKLVNSLTFAKTPTAIEPVDEAKTVFRIDLDFLRWPEELWDRLAADYPYATTSARSANGSILVMRGDWFASNASKPPFYNDFLQLPLNVVELERRLLTNQRTAEEEVETYLDTVVRGAFRKSNVALGNRMVQRHEAVVGSYWRSFDFKPAQGSEVLPARKDLFQHPLGPGGDEGFIPDGGEVIFNLPNGFQGYMLVDGAGQRIDKGPIDVVHDSLASTLGRDPSIVNGISCMACHFDGMKPASDTMARFIKEATFPPPIVESVLRLYRPDDLQKGINEDRTTFVGALKKIGLKPGTIEDEPILALVTHFENRLVDARTAAAELGLTNEQLEEKLGYLGGDPKLQAIRAELGGEGVPREQFVEIFEALRAFIYPGLAATQPAAEGDDRSADYKTASTEQAKTPVDGVVVPTPAVDVAQCDALAADRYETASADTGIPFAQIRPEAIDACRAAVAQKPGNAHYQYLFARALDANRKYTEAIEAYQAGAKMGSAPAMAGLGSMYEDGVGTATDLQEARRWYEQGAAQGSSTALNKLGSFYKEGKGGLESDIAKAAQLYQEAADAGSGVAARNLGAMYRDGEGVERDTARAVALFKLGDANGSAWAAADLGKYYRYGAGIDDDGQYVHLDPVEAAKWFTKSAQSGNAEGMRELGRMYYFGIGLAQDRKAARDWFKQASDKKDTLAGRYLSADAGDGAAMESLALTLGEDAPEPDLKELEFWLREAVKQGLPRAKKLLAGLIWSGVAADQGDDPAQLLIEGAQEIGDVQALADQGRLLFLNCQTSDGVRVLVAAAGLGNVEAMTTLASFYRGDDCGQREADEALRWYRAAAETGDADAKIALAHEYLVGEIVAQDFDAALSWYQSAGAAYDLAAVGDGFRTGSDDLPTDIPRAIQWYSRAAELGSADAQLQLGYYYRKGEDVREDVAKALAMFTASAEQGNGEAMANVGWLYAHGKGVDLNGPLAIDWYHKAAANGFSRASLLAGEVYELGRGLAKDLEKARIEYEAGAANYDVGSAVALAKLYPNGFPQPADDSKRRALFARAADLGDPYSKGMLGRFFYQGTGGEQSYSQARDWLESALTGRDASNISFLLDIYDRGLGTERNPTRAAELYFRASKAQKRDVDSMLELAGQLTAETRLAIQLKLRTDGLYTGDIDGEFGSSTREALVRFAGS